MDNKADIKELSFNFAVKIIGVYQHIAEAKKDFLLSRQLVKSATSIGASVNEAVLGLSHKDFLRHLSKALKESQETEYWLRLMYRQITCQKKNLRASTTTASN